MTAPAGPRSPERARFTSRAAVQVQKLEAEHRKLTGPAYIEQQARDQLHMCFPAQSCYVVIPGKHFAGLTAPVAHAPVIPWYERLWHSVRTADQVSGK